MNSGMGAELRIESIYDAAWATFGFQYDEAVHARDHFRSQIRHRFSQEVASEIQRHVAVALGRIRALDLPKPRIMRMQEFYELLALEMALQEIERRIEAGNTFFDSYVGGLFPMWWWERVLPLIDGGENPGYLRPESVVKFLEMVRSVDQRLPSGDQSEEMAEDFRQRRRELVQFLGRAVALREAVWCDL